MPSNTRENGFETLIVNSLVNDAEYEQGITTEYNKDYAIDEERLFRFLHDTQSDKLAELRIMDSDLEKDRFFKQLDKKLKSDGVIELLRKGLRYKHLKLDLFYVRPSAENPDAAELYEKNIFSVTRQLQYSKFNPRLALDICIFLNGLPIITMELKNQLTKQNYKDAIKQYKDDRSPAEPLFSFKRCIVHFAVDDSEVWMCTELKGDKSWFLPFNMGYHDGAGNPPNPGGIKTDYLWKHILSKNTLSNIIENYAQVIEEVDEDTGAKTYKQVFPRYHQLTVVTSLLNDAVNDGVGGRYLIQHSAGSGKSNSIAWLAHQLVGLKDDTGKEIFDTVIVVTDRINLDKQIKNTIRQFMQVSSTVGWAKSSGELKTLLDEGKKVIITIVHKFQFILDDISTQYKDRNFAILIDEAHSSQNGSLSAKMNMVLSGNVYDDEDDLEDKINTIIEGRKMVKNASYFAFTATPKNKTLEMFGKKVPQADGTVKPEPHYVYTMKQAIEEGFILDVLKYYTPVQSYYKLAKTVEDDPKFDKRRAQAILRYYVESNRYAIHEKAAIMVEHFHSEVIAKGKVGGKARAMVVASSIKRAVEYYKAINQLLEERHSPFKAIVAFSGTAEWQGRQATEADINGFPSAKIEKTFRTDPYRILVVANKFQTGFDEPLLHTMYVDKGLSDIKAVQTLSRLNRSHPDKKDTFILDFVNDPGIIKQAFDRYYKTTILSGETDVNKLNDLIDTMESIQVFTADDVDRFVELYLNDAERDQLDPILDHCVEVYKSLTIEEQIEFKSCAKSFSRTYNFLAAILPYGSVQWEKLAIFLNLLVPKLPSPEGEDYTEGLLDDVDLESYRAEARETMQIQLENENGEINPIPVGTDVGIDVPELDTLTNILKEFHDIFGNIEWTDEDKVRKQIQDLSEIVSRDETYQNAMRYSDMQNARAESDRATRDAILATMSSGVELYREVQANDSFRKWILDMVFNATYTPPVAARTSRQGRVNYTVSPDDSLQMVAEDTVPYGRRDGE
ncbi:MAG: type I restriction endonuclease subunit R [Clostridia bacterium]|nr:type I restriction endonuclease subunit R [Clostridia bacterium]